MKGANRGRQVVVRRLHVRKHRVATVFGNINGLQDADVPAVAVRRAIGVPRVNRYLRGNIRIHDQRLHRRLVSDLRMQVVRIIDEFAKQAAEACEVL